jgi:hypothetical protein
MGTAAVYSLGTNAQHLQGSVLAGVHYEISILHISLQLIRLITLCSDLAQAALQNQRPLLYWK